MDKRKPRGTSTSSAVADELELVKSVAWAWYQHGSGSDGKPTREFDAWRSKIDPKPSRYKVEALKDTQEVPSNNNSLLDNYEVERISKQLDSYIESSHAKHNVVAEVKNKKRISKGFWSRHVSISSCRSSRNDVVESQSLVLSRRPEKVRPAVVESVSCRPRPWEIRA